MGQNPGVDGGPLRVVRIKAKGGRGVVAAAPIDEGEVFESAPVVVIPAEEWDRVEEGVLGSYFFCWSDRLGTKAIVLGQASLINHSYRPNTLARKRYAELRMDFLALRPIAPGEELTINYNGEPEDDGPVGFEVHDP